MRNSTPLFLALLMFTATLAGCIGGDETSESVDITPYTEQIDANNVTINDLLSNISQLESDYADSQSNVGLLQRAIENLSVSLATLNQDIANLESEKTSLETQLASTQGEQNSTEQDVTELQSELSALNASINENMSTVTSLQLYYPQPSLICPKQMLKLFSLNPIGPMQTSQLKRFWLDGAEQIQPSLTSVQDGTVQTRPSPPYNLIWLPLTQPLPCFNLDGHRPTKRSLPSQAN